MHCPSCLAVLVDSEEKCHSCGFGLSIALDKKFGTVPLSLKVSDHGLIFKASECELLEKRVRNLERRFRNLHFAIMTLELSPRLNLREYAFWLINRCLFSPADARMAGNFSAVLLFDVSSRSVVLTTGYGLQEALPEETLGMILDLAAPKFGRQKYYRGTVGILRGIQRQLTRHASAKRSRARSAVAVVNPAMKPVEDIF